MYAQVQKFCKKCDDVIGNGCKEYICKNCNSKRSLLSQMFGKWPISQFSELADANQKEFWKSGSKTKQGLQTELGLIITQERIDSEINKVGGQFLPLGVYERQGYNTQNIIENCKKEYNEDLKEDTYLVNIRAVFKEEIERDTRNELLAMRDGSLRGRLSHYASPSAKKNKKRKRKSSSSSKSSTSSAPSNSSKASKKGKQPTAAPSKAAARATAKAAAKAKVAKEAEARQGAALNKRLEAAAKKEQDKAAKEAAKEDCTFASLHYFRHPA